jgi:hypothetical protein
MANNNDKALYRRGIPDLQKAPCDRQRSQGGEIKSQATSSFSEFQKKNYDPMQSSPIASNSGYL